MTPEEKKQFDELRREVEELKRWKEEKTTQQISYPLDLASQTILNNL